MGMNRDLARIQAKRASAFSSTGVYCQDHHGAWSLDCLSRKCAKEYQTGLRAGKSAMRLAATTERRIDKMWVQAVLSVAQLEARVTKARAKVKKQDEKLALAQRLYADKLASGYKPEQYN